MELLGFNKRVPREHGPAIREMEGGSPGGTYICFDQRGCACFPVRTLSFRTGEFAQRMEI